MYSSALQSQPALFIAVQGWAWSAGRAGELQVFTPRRVHRLLVPIDWVPARRGRLRRDRAVTPGSARPAGGAWVDRFDHERVLRGPAPFAEGTRAFQRSAARLSGRHVIELARAGQALRRAMFCQRECRRCRRERPDPVHDQAGRRSCQDRVGHEHVVHARIHQRLVRPSDVALHGIEQVDTEALFGRSRRSSCCRERGRGCRWATSAALSPQWRRSRAQSRQHGPLGSVVAGSGSRIRQVLTAGPPLKPTNQP